MTFAPPIKDILSGATALLPGPNLAATPSGGQGLTLNPQGQLPDQVLYQVLNNGALVAARRKLNLIQGSNVTLTIADDQANDRVNVTVASSGSTTYRKTTAKTVNTTITETDLLNGEITLTANDLGTNKMLRLYAHGDMLKNAGGGNQSLPRFKLKLGSTALLDTGVGPTNGWGDSVNRTGWQIDARIAELGATNSQWATIKGDLSLGAANGGNAFAAFTTGEGVYELGAATVAGTSRFVGGNSGAKDSTGTLLLELTVILPTSSASCEIVLKSALVVIE